MIPLPWRCPHLAEIADEPCGYDWIFARHGLPGRRPPGDDPKAAASDGSGEILSAVGRQGRAGDEAGLVVGQEDDAARDLLRLTQPTDRDEW